MFASLAKAVPSSLSQTLSETLASSISSGIPGMDKEIQAAIKAQIDQQLGTKLEDIGTEVAAQTASASSKAESAKSSLAESQKQASDYLGGDASGVSAGAAGNADMVKTVESALQTLKSNKDIDAMMAKLSITDEASIQRVAQAIVANGTMAKDVAQRAWSTLEPMVDKGKPSDPSSGAAALFDKAKDAMHSKVDEETTKAVEAAVAERIAASLKAAASG